MAQLTFLEAMIYFIMSIVTSLNSKIPILLILTLYRNLIAFNHTLVAPGFATYRNLRQHDKIRLTRRYFSLASKEQRSQLEK